MKSVLAAMVVPVVACALAGCGAHPNTGSVTAPEWASSPKTAPKATVSAKPFKDYPRRQQVMPASARTGRGDSAPGALAIQPSAVNFVAWRWPHRWAR
jgi:hypothetical protein